MFLTRRMQGLLALVVAVHVLIVPAIGMANTGMAPQVLSQVEAPAPLPPVIEPLDETDVKLEETLTQSFRERFKAVLDEAKNYLSAQCVPNAAVVLDLDETLIDNRAYFVIHKRYDTALWDKWMERAEAPAIPETLSFVHWLNKKGYAVYFVTGRKEHFRGATVRDLARVGVLTYAGLYMKPDTYDKASASNFKIDARKAIEAKGQKVLLILGDQESDLRGGTGTGFKLPNPIYFIP